MWAHAPLSCTALGKALLSTLADAEIKALYAEHPLAAVTQHSITGMGELLAQMAEIRKLGYAVEREENNGDVCCVAVPLRNREGRAVYALSVSAPLFRTDESRLKHFAALLLEAQPGIERFLKDTHE